MEVIKMDCPNCGAHLKRQQGEYFAKCPYCDSEIAFDSLQAEATVDTYRQQVNTFETMEAGRSRIRLEQKQWNRLKYLLIAACGILNFAGFTMVGYCDLKETESLMGPGVCALLLASAIFLAAPICLTLTVPDRDILTGEKKPGIRIKTIIQMYLILFGVMILSIVLAALFFV